MSFMLLCDTPRFTFYADYLLPDALPPNKLIMFLHSRMVKFI